MAEGGRGAHRREAAGGLRARGDAWTHTMLVVDEAAKLRDEAKKPDRADAGGAAARVGKAVAMQEKDGVIHAYGHWTAGVPLAEDFLRRLTGGKRRFAAMC